MGSAEASAEKLKVLKEDVLFHHVRWRDLNISPPQTTTTTTHDARVLQHLLTVNHRERVAREAHVKRTSKQLLSDVK